MSKTDEFWQYVQGWVADDPTEGKGETYQPVLPEYGLQRGPDTSRS
jgi:hypothetical protein